MTTSTPTTTAVPSDRARNRSERAAGLDAQRRRGLEPDERRQRGQHAGRDSTEPGLGPAVRHRQRRTAQQDSEDGEHQRDGDGLDGEHDPRREAHPAQHRHRGDRGQHDDDHRTDDGRGRAAEPDQQGLEVDRGTGQRGHDQHGVAGEQRCARRERRGRGKALRGQAVQRTGGGHPAGEAADARADQHREGRGEDERPDGGGAGGGRHDRRDRGHARRRRGARHGLGEHLDRPEVAPVEPVHRRAAPQAGQRAAHAHLLGRDPGRQSEDARPATASRSRCRRPNENRHRRLLTA